MDLTTIKTKTGKTMQDFSIPDELVQSDPSLVELVLKSESMNDKERQYWFNLSEIMTPSQTEKLRGILTRERAKLDEIEAKYGDTGAAAKPTAEDKAEQQQRVNEMSEMRAAKQRELKAREKEEQEAEKFDEDAILAELD